jgi:1-acyl-sn-glycerol-3-phosphate acyltransferase
MIYRILKVIARIAIRLFCRKVVINKQDMLYTKGPLLLACNHPNSFLDSVILDTLFDQPIWSLARGDVFKSRFITLILTSLKILPVYRVSEGVENLSENYKTFDACIDIFRKNGVVMIFSEGKCINEWHLRPLKKGTARLAFKAWQENIPLRVLPVAINYSSFRRFGKNVFIQFGEIMEETGFDKNTSEGIRYQQFNQQLLQQLGELVWEISKNDKVKQKRLLEIKPSLFKIIILAIPAVIGWLIHAPLYLPIRSFTWKRTNHNDHFDSVMMALLFFLYPVYLLLMTVLLWIFIHEWWVWIGVIVIPFTAWACIQLKPQLDTESAK